MIRISWCNERKEIDRLADFFARNVTQAYISHSELQFGRAQAPDKWVANLATKFKTELEARIPAQASAARRVASAYREDELIGIAYVTFNTDVPIPFIVLEDIVVERGKRSNGIGQQILDWVFAQARQEGIKRVFLESGKDNHAAHRFFERNGFREVSIVMMADLGER